MDFKEQFKTGDVVKINISKDSSNFYVTKILTIDYEKKFFVVHSINKDIPVNSFISVKREFKDIIFMFNTKVLGYTHNEHKNIIVLHIPKEINRIQRREFYRLPLNVPISVRNSADEICLGESLDISGLGMCVELDKKLYPNENVRVTIPFSTDFILEDIEGVVKRIEKGSKLPYKYGINFDYIDAPVREEIVSYIFQVQKMLLKISNNMWGGNYGLKKFQNNGCQYFIRNC